MQKKVFLSVLMSACLMGSVTVFNACSNDEVEETEVQSKADYLRAKATEFSKKYGVDMSLNEDNIERLAETLTVEQLERDFQALASLKGENMVHTIETPKTIKKGMKIRSTATLEEVRHDVQTGSSSHWVSCWMPCYQCKWRDNDKFYGEAKIQWSYDPVGSLNNKLEFNIVLDATYCHSRFVGSSSSWDSLLFWTTPDGLAFTAYGDIKLKSENYIHTCTLKLSVSRTDGQYVSVYISI